MDVKASPYSNLKIFHHADLLKKIEAGERVAPIYIRIKPTNVCNQNCYYCHYKNAYLSLDEYNPNDYIPQDKMMEIIDDMRDMGVKAVTFSGGGEPLVYPYIVETMERVLDAGIDLSIITNGTMLKGRNAEILSRAKWVRLSIDASHESLYSRLRGVPEGAYDALCQNIERFARMKSDECEFGVNYVVGKDNHECVYEMAERMKSLGVNHVKFAPLCSNATEAYHAPFKVQVMEDIARAKDLQDENFRVIDLYTSDFQRVSQGIMIFDRAYEKCYIKEFVCVIAANQKVYYCHDKAYLKNGQIGDLTQKRFKDMWFSEETREKFKRFNAKTICNEHCVYDDRNILLNTFFSLDKKHINFI